jgi:hypothetical protein
MNNFTERDEKYPPTTTDKKIRGIKNIGFSLVVYKKYSTIVGSLGEVIDGNNKRNKKL